MRNQQGALRAKVYGGVVILIVMVFWLIHKSVGGDYTVGSTKFGEADALLMCQKAIRARANDRDNAKVPYVRNFGDDDEYYFAWGAQTKMVRMRNGLGLEVPIAASCIIDGGSRRITSLTLDGKTVIGG